jgi:hypothetical protein
MGAEGEFNMRYHSLTWLLMVLANVAVAAPKDEPVSATFKFAPPVNTARVETRTVEVTDEFSGPPRREQRTRNVWTTESGVKRSASGLLFIDEVKSVTLEINDKPSTNPMHRVLTGTVRTNTIAANGEFVRSDVNRDFSKELRKVLPTNAWKAAEAELSAQKLEAIERNVWSEVVTPFVGRTVRQGEVWRTTLKRPDLPELSVITMFPAISRSGSNTTVKIVSFGCSNEKLLKDYNLENATALFGSEGREFLGHLLTGKPLVKYGMQQVVDADTMTIIAFDQFKQMVGPAETGIRVTTERIQRRFDDADDRDGKRR